MEALAWIVSLICAFCFGFFVTKLLDFLAEIKFTIESKVNKPSKAEEPTSIIIDPDDPIQTAQYEHQKLMKKINPQDEE